MRTVLYTLTLVLSFALCRAQETHLQQWQDNKFSMFIHFGAYSELGGVWRGQNVTVGYSEQIQSHGHIFSDEYEKVTERFNPSKWNADSIASLAKRAGMRSIVITSKHHDGFCMFKTETTRFNIVDGTPFRRDVVKELSDACRRYGLNFGLYYSIIDWHYPQAYPTSSHNADFITPEHHAFSKRQLRELLTNYGPISELWFDMGSQTLQQSAELKSLVKELQPNCLISGRIGNDQGDFCVMGDNEYPDYAIATPWQVPASMYDETWGYRSWQKHVPVEEKANEKLLSLVKTVTRGGNYLLNIGPTGTGEVTEFEKNVLTKMGSWLRVNGEALYGTQSLRVPRSSFGEITFKGNKAFFHVWELPANLQLPVTGINTKLKSAYLVDAPTERLIFQQQGDRVTMQLPNSLLKESPVRVVALEFDGEISVPPPPALPLTSTLSLSSYNATHHYSFSGIDYYGSYRRTVRYEWNILTTKKTVTPVITYSDEEKNHTLILQVDGSNYPVVLDNGMPQELPSSKIKWGPVHVVGELKGLIGSRHGDAGKVDLQKPWGRRSWESIPQWSNQDLYTKPAEEFANWYWYQTVSVDKPAEILVQLPTNDGVSIHLNGKERFVINNNDRDPSKLTTVVLPLTTGENQILVKYFNRFGKEIKLGLLPRTPAKVYQLTLSPISLVGGKTHTVTLRLPDSHTMHENVDAPNVKINLK